MLFQPAQHLSPGSTPSKQNPITQASLERLNTCFYFLFLQSISTHSLPLSCLLFVLQCKEDEAMGMRRAPLLLYFLSTEMLFTRKISSQHLILLAVDCGCTYSTMHLLNCLLLKLYKHCCRSHCRCTPSPSAPLYNERHGKRAHKKFRGHCIDGMLDGAPVAPVSNPPELHGSL